MEDTYTEEARQRWGDTEAFRQSVERTRKMTKDDWKRIADEGAALMNEIVAHMNEGPKSPEVQKLIARHYDSLRNFYEPNLKLYRGLGAMYAADPRFAAFYNKHHPQLAEFMRDAIIVFCDANEKSAA